MAKKVFKNPNDLEQAFKAALIDVIKNEVYEVVRDELIDEVENRVYSTYSPTKYQRRESQGGLSDPKNYAISTPRITDKTARFVIENITKGNGWDEFNGRLINDLIEGTSGFAGDPNTNMPARPYTEYAYANLISSASKNEMKRALVDGLRVHGFNITIK